MQQVTLMHRQWEATEAAVGPTCLFGRWWQWFINEVWEGRPVSHCSLQERANEGPEEPS